MEMITSTFTEFLLRTMERLSMLTQTQTPQLKLRNRPPKWNGFKCSKCSKWNKEELSHREDSNKRKKYPDILKSNQL
jgi:hypothetical protein